MATPRWEHESTAMRAEGLGVGAAAELGVAGTDAAAAGLCEAVAEAVAETTETDAGLLEGEAGSTAPLEQVDARAGALQLEVAQRNKDE